MEWAIEFTLEEWACGVKEEGGEMIGEDNKRRLPQLGFLMIRGVKMGCPPSIGLVYTSFLLVDWIG